MTRDAAGGAVDTNRDEDSILISANERTIKTTVYTPSAEVRYIYFVIYGSDVANCELGVDNAQLEIGSLTDYVENA